MLNDLGRILKRLRDSGWEKEIDSLNEFQIWDLERIPGIRQAAKLTPSCLSIRSLYPDITG